MSRAHAIQVLRFLIVGTMAAGVHFSTVVMLVQGWHVAPLLANVGGFLVSFQVSYWGHRLWTFSDTIVLHRTAYPRLVLVQLVNFVLNEMLYYYFLSLGFSYPVALLMVLLILPVFTFISNKFWVFQS